MNWYRKSKLGKTADWLEEENLGELESLRGFELPEVPEETPPTILREQLPPDFHYYTRNVAANTDDPEIIQNIIDAYSERKHSHLTKRDLHDDDIAALALSNPACPTHLLSDHL